MFPLKGLAVDDAGAGVKSIVTPAHEKRSRRIRTSDPSALSGSESRHSEEYEDGEADTVGWGVRAGMVMPLRTLGGAAAVEERQSRAAWRARAPTTSASPHWRSALVSVVSCCRVVDVARRQSCLGPAPSHPFTLVSCRPHGQLHARAVDPRRAVTAGAVGAAPISSSPSAALLLTLLGVLTSLFSIVPLVCSLLFPPCFCPSIPHPSLYCPCLGDDMTSVNTYIGSDSKPPHVPARPIDYKHLPYITTPVPTSSRT
ncbi:hypothetical protein MSAN_00125000 [Mycena sanguinolenta]|uniref:Uncharacterized protein n=1 Tax=Mycena sanguinolenta TaxID=230812 RepID=A0A8H7DKT3_9AGAR|nr:hypothetical protein MSAN_00125000 [Mycena sanguinolenta]